MARIRQIKPAWWLDKDLRRGASADAREFYIGLWMLADDAGWLVWDTERIGAELYPYAPVARREKNVEAWADVLERLDEGDPHLVVYTCGHAVVPKMPQHQRITGKVTRSTHDAHARQCREAVSRLRLTEAHGAGEPTSDEGSPGRVGNEERNGTERNGPARGAHRSEFTDAMARHGAPRELLGSSS